MIDNSNSKAIVTLGIMQPYFFPYIGYFSLIKHTDEFIIFDVVQYIRHGWIDRNRILSAEAWQYINVPLVKPDGNRSIISALGVNYSLPWGDKILKQMSVYKNIAPYYEQVCSIVRSVLSREYSSVSQLNVAALKAVCNYLGFDRRFPLFSEMDVEIEPVLNPDEWALNICKSLGVKNYLNAIGGQGFFDRKKYADAGINIGFLQMASDEYPQRHAAPFEPFLSIIDVIMFNSPDEVNLMLDHFSIV